MGRTIQSPGVEINEIEKMEEDYYFSEWYDTIKDVCFTPKSLFFKIL